MNKVRVRAVLLHVSSCIECSFEAYLRFFPCIFQCSTVSKIKWSVEMLYFMMEKHGVLGYTDKSCFLYHCKTAIFSH